MKSIDLHLVVFFILISRISTDQRIICYYTNWSVYRHSVVPVLYPDEIDATLCTHIHYAFASIDPLTLDIEPSENHDVHFTTIFSTPLYLRLLSLKQLNPSLKLLVAVGGWSAGSESFNNILTNATTRRRFIEKTKEFLIKWKFDGIDLDWEYPADLDRGARNDSREQFNILIKEMRQSFENDDQQLMLTAAVSANPAKIDQGYIVSEFCDSLDYVSIMTYDYHGAWDNITGINAPLYGRRLEGDDEENKWNVNASVYHWLEKGCPANKINLGLAMYGRSFTIANDSNSVGIGSTVLGNGLAGPYTKENGTLAYFEICQKLRVSNWTTVFDGDARAPYAYSASTSPLKRQWVGFDDLKSITLKVLYAQSLDLGGVMLWSLDQDDYTGLFCDQGKFPLTRRAYDVVQSAMNSKKQDPITSSTSSTKPKNDLLSVKTDKVEDEMLTPTQLSSDWRMLNLSVKNSYSFSLFFLVLLFVE